MSDSFDLGEPPQPQVASQQAYRVLARKYRPQRFSELIGQDAMVQTLGNAIKRDRLAHAFLMTGVRGVGKTSTARLIAKALNCENGPTIDPCGECDACRAITEGRHMDVIEMDAASNTGVDDVREIIEAVRYSAVSARYKVYIIDEVHMLSKNAFNALLKTLEEPPPHVKFLFATTEVQKVPITVLSRCQRFDLRRISAEQLAAHFAHVARAEDVAVEDEALMLIARASEGSARDGLSILDQAIAHSGTEGDGRVTAAQVREMLGLSDRGATRDLFGLLLSGDAPAALASLRQQHDLGVDPGAIFKGLLEICHGTTLAKVGAIADPALSAEERAAHEDWAGNLSFALLHRMWQLLLKGHSEVVQSADPRTAADMAALRIIHAGQLPDPGDLARKLESGAPLVVNTTTSTAGVAPSQPTSFEAMVAGLEAAGKHMLGDQLRRDFGLVSFAPNELVLRPLRPQGDANYLMRLSQAVRDTFGPDWRVDISEDQAAPSLEEQAGASRADDIAAIEAMPIVKAALEAFPDAKLDYDAVTLGR
jgi:DNA polymerase III subunit gamma/tau